jgi:ComF family protein
VRLTRHSLRRILARVGRPLRDLEALLLPAACLGCERPLGRAEERRMLCGRCWFSLRPIAPPACERCGQPLDRWQDARAPMPPTPRQVCCAFCRQWPESLGWAGSAVWLDPGAATELAHALKYGGWTVAARAMAEAIARYCGPRAADFEILAPVPLGKLRRRERGYNQAAVLALELGRALRKPVAAELLVRTRETRSQTALGPRQRRENVAGAFSLSQEVRGPVLLVDDVLTTGATLASCAAALSAGGAPCVGAVTFARALVPS